MCSRLSTPLLKSIAAALALSFFAYLLPVMTAQAGCVWRGTAPFCNGQCKYGEITRDRLAIGIDSLPGFGETCISGDKVLCCTPEATHTPAAPATEDTKTPGVGSAATEVIHPGERVKKTSGVGNAATEVIHEGKKDKKTPGVGSAATEVIQKPATPAPSTGGQQQQSQGNEENDEHHHKNHKHQSSDEDDNHHKNHKHQASDEGDDWQHHKNNHQHQDDDGDHY
jgi:hypothetical protein